MKHIFVFFLVFLDPILPVAGLEPCGAFTGCGQRGTWGSDSEIKAPLVARIIASLIQITCNSFVFNPLLGKHSKGRTFLAIVGFKWRLDAKRDDVKERAILSLLLCAVTLKKEKITVCLSLALPDFFPNQFPSGAVFWAKSYIMLPWEQSLHQYHTIWQFDGVHFWFQIWFVPWLKGPGGRRKLILVGSLEGRVSLWLAISPARRQSSAQVLPCSANLIHSLSDISASLWVNAVHNVYSRDYLFLRTEQAGTYLKMSLLLFYSTYICPKSFSPAEHG